MRVKCINNENVEGFITKDKVYTVLQVYRKGYEVMCDNRHPFPFYEGRFEIVEGSVDEFKEDIGRTTQEDTKPVSKPKQASKKGNSLFSQVFNNIGR